MILSTGLRTDERPRQTSHMCSRYMFKSRADIIAETFGVEVPPAFRAEGV